MHFFHWINLYFLQFVIIVTSTSGQNCVDKIIHFDNDNYKKFINIDYNAANVRQLDKELVLSLDQNTGGTRISSRQPILYGTIEAKMRISHGSNVITSFILMAQNGDEIDFEFVGKDDNIIQTNFFYRGQAIYDVNARFYAASKKLSKNFNTYKIIWTPNYYEWWFNGNFLRRLNKSNTINYPNSPSLVQFGIWKAPNSKWAGNGTNWSQGPYNFTIQHIHINCFTSSQNQHSATATTITKKITTLSTFLTTTMYSSATVTPSTSTSSLSTVSPSTTMPPSTTSSPNKPKNSASCTQNNNILLNLYITILLIMF